MRKRERENVNDAKALDAELTGLVYDSEVTIVDEDGVERRIGYGLGAVGAV